MYIRIYIFNFKKQQTNKQKKQESKKAKETREEKIYPKNWLKKWLCGRPGEDFSCHPHFWKQEFFFWPNTADKSKRIVQIAAKIILNDIHSQNYETDYYPIIATIENIEESENYIPFPKL